MEPDRFERYDNYKNEVFQGYDKANSFVKLDNISEGRCNTELLPCLYTANSINCCISEVGPKTGDFVSVATIKVLEKLKIMTLGGRGSNSDGISTIVDNVVDSSVFFQTFEIFSLPQKGEEKYILQQYLSRRMIEEGYDGVYYRSSTYTEPGKDKNYAIYNYKKCEAISSKLYIIRNVSYDFK